MNTNRDSRLAHWQQHVERFSQSGISAKAYCAQASLSYHCFLYWRGKLTQSKAEPSSMPNSPSTSGFVQVQSSSSVKPTYPSCVSETDLLERGLKLTLPNGLMISNIQTDNLALLGLLLEGLS